MPLIENLKNVARSVGTSNFGPAATNFVYSEPLAIPTGYAAYRAYKDENDPYVPKKELGANVLKNFLMAYGGQRLYTDAPALKAHMRDLFSSGAEKLSSVKHQAFMERLGLEKEAARWGQAPRLLPKPGQGDPLASEGLDAKTVRRINAVDDARQLAHDADRALFEAANPKLTVANLDRMTARARLQKIRRTAGPAEVDVAAKAADHADFWAKRLENHWIPKLQGVADARAKTVTKTHDTMQRSFMSAKELKQLFLDRRHGIAPVLSRLR